MHKDHDWRNELRSLPSIVGRAPTFEVDSVPEEPRGLFRQWLSHAIGSQVPEPHAATLSTIGEDGMPDARVLIIKDVDEACGFHIATGDESAKGRQLLGNPACALSFYWGPLARAVRVRGIARRGSAEESAADFRARNPEARAIAMAGQQSSILNGNTDVGALAAQAAATLDTAEARTSPHWSLWRIEPVSIEFWQGDPGRNHQRLRYNRDGNGWRKEQLWP